MKRNKKKILATLENEYVRTTGEETKISKQKSIRLMRRLLMFALLCLVVFGSLTAVLLSKNETLKVKEQQREEAHAKLQEQQDQQEMLNLQIKQLEDDEYIAKLLRKEFFLSEQGEIIFIIPEDGKKEEEK